LPSNATPEIPLRSVNSNEDIDNINIQLLFKKNPSDEYNGFFNYY